MKPEFTSISKRGAAPGVALAFWITCLTVGVGSLLSVPSHAMEGLVESSEEALPLGERPEAEDFSQTPFTGYAEFNEEEDETKTTEFFQSGRFFGVSGGVGINGVTGNRGLLWRGGFPMVDVRIHVWLTQSVSLQLQFFTVPFSFRSPLTSGETAVNMFRVGADMKYYFPTENVAAPIAFSNPYLLGGIGSYTKNQFDTTTQQSSLDGTVGVALGGGFEFPIVNRKVYVNIEGKFHFLSFSDTQAPVSASIPNLSGFFYSTSASVLFAW